MTKYIIKRLLWAIPTLLLAATIIFLIMRVLPGDIAVMILGGEEGASANPEELEALRHELGLDLPLIEQYGKWIWGLVRGDLGVSLWSGDTVWQEISVRFPYTITLMVLSVLISIIIAVPVGILSALKQDSWIDYGLRSFAIMGLSIPSFWFGLMLLMISLRFFSWSPPLDYAPIYVAPLIALQQLFLPAITLGYRSSAVSARMMRSSMLEVMREDYVRTARAKGLRENTVIYVHALRNAILPVITMFGLEIIMIFSAAVIVETIFNIPGLGGMVVGAIMRRDFPVVQGTVTFIVAIVLIVNLIVDIIYGWIDPRVRLH
jgi:peptide/nickel transport system permease protein